MQNDQDNEFYGHYIQIGPFTSMKAAEGLKIKLQAEGIEAFSYQQGKRNYGIWYGNFRNREEATAEADRLVSKNVIKKYLVTSRQEAYPVETRESQLSREAKRMEKVILAKHFEVKFYAECSTGENQPEPGVVCMMYFPEQHSNMRYVHKIEALTLDVAKAFARRDSSEAFELYAVMKDGGDKAAAEKVKQSQIKGDYTPVRAYSYSKHFDRLFPLWPSL